MPPSKSLVTHPCHYSDSVYIICIVNFNEVFAMSGLLLERWLSSVLGSFYWSLSLAALMGRCSGQLLLIIVSGSFDVALFWTAFIDHCLGRLWWGAVLDSFYWSLSRAALMGRCSGQLLLIVVSGSFDSAVLDSFYWAFDSLIKRQIYLRIFKKLTKLN